MTLYVHNVGIARQDLVPRGRRCIQQLGAFVYTNTLAQFSDSWKFDVSSCALSTLSFSHCRSGVKQDSWLCYNFKVSFIVFKFVIGGLFVHAVVYRFRWFVIGTPCISLEANGRLRNMYRTAHNRMDPELVVKRPWKRDGVVTSQCFAVLQKCDVSIVIELSRQNAKILRNEGCCG